MTDDRFTCPLCGRADDRIGEIGRHLRVAHRDSSLTEAFRGSTTSGTGAPRREDDGAEESVTTVGTT